MKTEKTHDKAPKTWYVLRDGEVLYGPDNELRCFMWLHKHSPHSVHHCTNHEGYKITRKP